MAYLTENEVIQMNKQILINLKTIPSLKARIESSFKLMALLDRATRNHESGDHRACDYDLTELLCNI